MIFKKLIDMAEIITTNNKRYTTPKVFVTPRDIDNNFIFNRVAINGIELPSKTVSNLKENDILICKLEDINDVILIDKATKDFAFSNDFVIIRPKTEYVDFLCFFFLSDYFKSKKRELLSGVNKRILRVDSIENLDVLVVENDEKIKELKSTWTSYYNNLSKILELISKNKTKLNTIYNYYVLGKDKENKMKKDYFENDVPESWEVKEIKDVVSKIIEGQKKILRCSKTGVPIILDNNICDNSLNLVNVKYLNEKDSKYLNNGFIPCKNDILISKKNGFCYQVDEFTDFNIFDGVVCITPDETQINVDFLFMLINSDYIRQFFINRRRIMDVSAIEHIHILVPPIEDQIEIVEILQDFTLKNKNINKKALIKVKEMENLLYNKVNDLFINNI